MKSYVFDPSLTWSTLADASPSLASFEPCGRQAAVACWSGWLEWVAQSSQFRSAVYEAAGTLGVDAGEVQAAAVDHLATVYRRAQRGQQDRPHSSYDTPLDSGRVLPAGRSRAV